MHIKDVPADVVKFAGKHKWVMIGGAVLAGGAVLYLANKAPANDTQASTDYPYVSSYSPVSGGYAGGGGGSLVPVADAGGSTSLTPSSNSAVPTASYSGAYGTYNGLDPTTAAGFDLSRQNLEYDYNANIYGNTLAADVTLAGMNLDAFNSQLAYGSNASAANNSLAMAAIAAGYAPDDVSSLLNAAYRKNGVNPQASYNAPSYFNVPGTFGSGTSPNTSVQDVNRVTNNSGGQNSQGATIAAGDPVKQDWRGYVESYSDLSAAFHAAYPTGDSKAEAAWGAAHYLSSGAQEGRSVALTYA